MINEYELISKTKEYKEYIDNHIKNVQKAWSIIDKATSKYKLNSWGQQNGCNAHMFINKFIRNHDKSKYSIEEFEGYRKKFYPVVGEDFDEEEFQKAWEHHQKHNLHHWQSMKAIDYDHVFILEYTIEMICDWFAMAMQFGESHRDYYNKNKDKIELQKWQHELIEEEYQALDLWVAEEP